MICRHGDVIHIVGAKCEHGQKDCSWKVYHNLYTVCEGKQTCHSSGLRLLGLRSICEKDLRVTANVFVDYICIQASLSDEKCSGNIRVLSPRFGVIKSPGFPNNPDGNPNSCYWAIYQGHGQHIEVNVHAAYSQERTTKCTPQFLQVNYTDCTTFKWKVEYFCHVSRVNIPLKSCGSVFIQSFSYKSGEDRGNRFLLSYEVKGMSMKTPAYTPYLRPCNSMLPYSNAIEHSQGSNNTRHSMDDEGIFDPVRFSLIFRIVVINFFLFIIAFCLVVGIILICYKYRKAKIRGKYNLTTQSDTDSGRQTTSDTQMQTFSVSTQEEDVRSRSSFTHPAQHKHNTYASLSTDEPYASVNRAHCRSVGSYNEIKSENRMSSFRPSESKNPYASYDSLDYDVPSDLRNDIPEVSTNNHVTYHPDEELPPPPSEAETETKQPYENTNHVQTNMYTSDVPHYTINDDDYAIVQKPPKTMDRDRSNNYINSSHHSNIPKSNSSSPSTMQIIVNEPSANYSPNKTNSIHTPTDPPPRRSSQFSSDVGFLPHHDCMLADHHCVIPPVPPSPARQNGYTNKYNDRF
ncbi:hypothetical protein FSP39_008000 [Pinctada imbricata]|uniref:CUB domain-containing protein n=1 Tax=Pinctada imbricata TaxID=66713 RepID=A0AA88YNF0_PINIB|nr:hypothetical protein FSP39_008000 [Pinctada imbricata]